MKLTVRDMLQDDIDAVGRYFVDASPEFLNGMGVDVEKVPPMETWREMLSSGLGVESAKRTFHFVIWEVDGEPVGHSNVGNLTFGKEGLMHIHLWDAKTRQRGHGREFVRMSIDRYFELFELERLNCEPYVLNPAPNRTLGGCGFEFIRSHVTVPGMMNFRQEVNSWVLSRGKWLGMR